MSKFIKITNNGIEIGDVVLQSSMDVRAYIATIYQTTNLGATIGAHTPKDILIQFWSSRSGTKDITAYLSGSFREIIDLPVGLTGWFYNDLNTTIGAEIPKDLFVTTQIWRCLQLEAFLDSHSPSNLPIYIDANPQFGSSLPVSLTITELKDLHASFYVWTKIKDFNTIFKTYHISDLLAGISTSGGYKDLEVILPMQTGWANLYVTLKPNIKKISTIIKIHLMEHKNLYVSINKGFPCNFGSAYKDFNVTMFINPEYILYVSLYGSLGSGNKSFRVHLNKEFDWYMDNLPVNLTLHGIKDAYFNFKTCRYKNDFENIYLNYKSISFNHPRRHITGGIKNLEVLLNGYTNKTLDLTVELKALYQLPPVLQSSGEIELWNQDPPEVVRLVELMFEQQVHEYIWSSAEQRAYSRELWEKWILMSKSYPKTVTYGGQLDYFSVQTLFNITKYSTMDEALRYLIDTALITESMNLDVYIDIKSAVKKLEINFSIIDKMKDLIITINPVREQDLSVNFTAI